MQNDWVSDERLANIKATAGVKMMVIPVETGFAIIEELQSLRALTEQEADPVDWEDAYKRLYGWLLQYPKFTLGDLGQLERDLGSFVREPGSPPTVAHPAPQEVSEEMVERACEAYANSRYEGTAEWPIAFDDGEQKNGRANMRAALTTALSLQVKEGK